MENDITAAILILLMEWSNTPECSFSVFCGIL